MCKKYKHIPPRLTTKRCNMGIIRLTAQSVNKSNLLHRFHHHNNIKHKTIPVLFTQCPSVCVFVCVSVSSQDTHFGRLKKVLDKEHIANFGLWWHTFCFFLLSVSMIFLLLLFFNLLGFLVNQSNAGLTCTILEDCTALHCTDIHLYVHLYVPQKNIFIHLPASKKLIAPPPDKDSWDHKKGFPFGIGAFIHISWESLCLLYVMFFLVYV